MIAVPTTEGRRPNTCASMPGKYIFYFVLKIDNVPYTVFTTKLFNELTFYHETTNPATC